MPRVPDDAPVREVRAGGGRSPRRALRARRRGPGDRQHRARAAVDGRGRDDPAPGDPAARSRPGGPLLPDERRQVLAGRTSPPGPPAREPEPARQRGPPVPALPRRRARGAPPRGDRRRRRGGRPGRPRRLPPGPAPRGSRPPVPDQRHGGRRPPPPREREPSPDRVAHLSGLPPRALRRAGRAGRLPGGRGGRRGHLARGRDTSSRSAIRPSTSAGCGSFPGGSASPPSRSTRAWSGSSPRSSASGSGWASGWPSCPGRIRTGACFSTSSAAGSAGDRITPRERQPYRWVTPAELAALPMPPADATVVARLTERSGGSGGGARSRRPSRAPRAGSLRGSRAT